MKSIATTVILMSLLILPLVAFEEIAVKYSGSDAVYLQQLGVTIVLDRTGNPELRRICEEMDVDYWRIYTVFTLKGPAVGPTDRVLIGEDGSTPSGRMARRGFFSPAWEDLRQAKIEAIAADVAVTRPAGISLDMVRWYMECDDGSKPRNQAWEWESIGPDATRDEMISFSFDPETLSRFQQDSGIQLASPVTDPQAAAPEVLTTYSQQWTQWKEGQVTQMIAAIREAVHAVDPTIQIMVQLVPWDEHEYDNARGEVLGQNPVAMSAHTDIFSPMVYHSLLGRPANWISQYSSLTQHQTNTPVWPCIQAIAHGTNDQLQMSPQSITAAWQATALFNPTAITLYGPKDDDAEVIQVLQALRNVTKDIPAILP